MNIDIIAIDNDTYQALYLKGQIKMNAIVKVDVNPITVTVDRDARLTMVKGLVLNGLAPNSHRAYNRALTDFINWYIDNDNVALNRASVMAHVEYLRTTGVTDKSINQRLAAIRKLAKEAAYNDLIDSNTAHAIQDIENIKIKGKKLGNWLTKIEVENALSMPDTNTLKGLRDRAILAVLFGAGLRREELCNLTLQQLQQRDGRWIIANIEGKHGKTRSVPIAAWIKAVIDKWLEQYDTNDYIFPSMRKGNHLSDVQMTTDAIYKLVKEYLPNIAPHDLRRTFGVLAYKGGADLKQIQLTYGHDSIETTERYLNVAQDLQNAPSDAIKLDIVI